MTAYCPRRGGAAARRARARRGLGWRQDVDRRRAGGRPRRASSWAPTSRPRSVRWPSGAPSSPVRTTSRSAPSTCRPTRVPGGPFDAAISQFGVMFFEEPVVGFANIRAHLVPGGRLVFACWQSSERNPWTFFPAVAEFVPPPPEPAPGKSPDRAVRARRPRADDGDPALRRLRRHQADPARDHGRRASETPSSTTTISSRRSASLRTGSRRAGGRRRVHAAVRRDTRDVTVSARVPGVRGQRSLTGGEGKSTHDPSSARSTIAPRSRSAE